MTVSDAIRSPWTYEFKRKMRAVPELIGTRYTLPDGEVLELVEQNDLGVPYFVVVKRGRKGKRMVTCAWLEADLYEQYPPEQERPTCECPNDFTDGTGWCQQCGNRR